MRCVVYSARVALQYFGMVLEAAVLDGLLAKNPGVVE